MEIKIGNKKYLFKDETPEQVIDIFKNKIKEISYDFYISNKDYIPNTKKYVYGECANCGNKTKTTVNKLRRKSMTQDLLFCSLKCASNYTTSLEEWKDKNSKAQLVAQNKEEQKRKNSKGVKLSRKKWSEKQYQEWREKCAKNNKSEDKRNKNSITTKNRWKNDEEFRKKMLNSFNDMNRKNVVGIFKSINSGDIVFESNLELFYLFFMDLYGYEIERFQDYIEYEIEGKKRYYIPDFVVDNNIIEIKSIHFLKNGKFDKRKEISKKIDYALDYVKENDYNDYYLYTESDLISKFNISVPEFKSIFSFLFDGGFIEVKKKMDWMYKKRRNTKTEEIFEEWKRLK